MEDVAVTLVIGMGGTPMSWIRFVALAIPLSGSCCYGQASPSAATEKRATANSVFSIAVDPPVGAIHLGSPINVALTVTNTSGKEIYWVSDRGKDTVYKTFAILLMKDGREVETTFFNRKISGRNRPDDPQEVETGSSISAPLVPGKMFVMAIDLTRLYEIKEPGLYRPGC
jgi:hypothetical protein